MNTPAIISLTEEDVLVRMEEAALEYFGMTAKEVLTRFDCCDLKATWGGFVFDQWASALRYSKLNARPARRPRKAPKSRPK